MEYVEAGEALIRGGYCDSTLAHGLLGPAGVDPVDGLLGPLAWVTVEAGVG